MRQESLFIHDAIYNHQAKEALSIHAWYVAKELGDAYALGREAAATILAMDALPHRQRNMDLYDGLPQARAHGIRLCSQCWVNIPYKVRRSWKEKHPLQRAAYPRAVTLAVTLDFSLGPADPLHGIPC